MSLTAIARLKKRRLLVRSLKKWIPKLRYLLFLVGVGWLFIFPSEKYSKNTYISENALLPGQVNTYYSWSQVFDATAYRDRIESLSNLSNIEKVNYIEGELRKAGLKTATQNFSVISSGKVISGINTFGVLNSPRTDGTEALVLSAPWKSKDGVTTNVNGIAAALSIVKFFKNYTYWSKDIIILITDGGEAGVQAWLESYHDHKQSGIEASPLLLRSGAIQAAINLDFPGTSSYKALGIFFEGLNGQLPNLDLINTVIRVCHVSNSIPIMIHDSGHYYTHYDSGDYRSSFYNLIKSMKYQALGHPTGSHGLFFRYKIDAITLYGQVDGPGNSYDFLEIGSIVESTFRSLNNLLEHLHQSFFFYLLPSPERYISIGSYLPPAILLAVGLIFHISFALELWGTTSDDAIELISSNDNVQPSSSVNAPESAPLAYLRRPREILMPVAALVISHFAGIIIFFVVKNHFELSQISNIFGVAGYLFTLAITTNISTIATAGLISAFQSRSHKIKKSDHHNQLSPSPDWIILKSVTLAFTAMIISCLSLLNFSLAVFISIIVVIPFSLFQPSAHQIIRYLELIVLVLISPPGILIISKTNIEEFLRWTIMEYELFGNYFLPFICCLYWPIILVYVVIIFSPIK
ncbi:Gaa1-domain-containing protein [Gigaspora margarita]|uniref:Gaa1-domain-containing protein n=1 Tax=Gigaspora margarita TaxID=4874 RepID=A0A8H4A707_GIGMA|nr:Gaa1-domain-containing protein [Gigaspora margarita]